MSTHLAGWEFELHRVRVSLAIGVHSHEREGRQDVLVTVRGGFRRPQRLRQIGETLDYDFVHRRIKALEQRPHTDLQEEIVGDLASGLMADTDLDWVEVRTAKPDAYPDCEWVGIRLLLTREDVQAEAKSDTT